MVPENIGLKDKFCLTQAGPLGAWRLAVALFDGWSWLIYSEKIWYLRVYKGLNLGGIVVTLNIQLHRGGTISGLFLNVFWGVEVPSQSVQQIQVDLCTGSYSVMIKIDWPSCPLSRVFFGGIWAAWIILVCSLEISTSPFTTPLMGFETPALGLFAVFVWKACSGGLALFAKGSAAFCVKFWVFAFCFRMVQ